MKIACVTRGVFALLALLTLPTPISIAETPSDVRASRVLFGEFETVFYSKADLLAAVASYAVAKTDTRDLPKSNIYDSLSNGSLSILSLPFSFLADGLETVRKGNSVSVLKNSESVLIGARDFTAPNAFGMSLSQFCYVIVLDKRRGLNFSTSFRDLHVVSAVDGNVVWSWLGKLHEGQPKRITYYAAIISGSYLLVSNNSDVLKVTAGELISSTLVSSPRQLPNLTQVSQHEYWAYRRPIQGGAIGKDPSYLFELTPHAEALLFFADLTEKVGVFQIFGQSVDEKEVAKMNTFLARNEVAQTPLLKFKLASVGMCEAIIDLSVKGPLQGLDLVPIIGWFGFTIYM
jgi:hypothetical protein